MFLRSEFATRISQLGYILTCSCSLFIIQEHCQLPFQIVIIHKIIRVNNRAEMRKEKISGPSEPLSDTQAHKILLPDHHKPLQERPSWGCHTLDNLYPTAQK